MHAVRNCMIRDRISRKRTQNERRKETLKSGIWVKSLFSAGKGDAVKERRAPIFVTLSLWVECLGERSHSIPVLRVQIDVTKVSIKKMDITGNNEVAGARLLLKDKEEDLFVHLCKILFHFLLILKDNILVV